MPRFVTISMLASVSFAASLDRSAAPPLTEQELFDRSDLVVDARVVAVVCDGAFEEGRFVRLRYLSTFETLRVLKGHPIRTFQIRGHALIDRTSAPANTNDDAMAEGWVGRLHLKASGALFEAIGATPASPAPFLLVAARRATPVRMRA